MKWHELCYCYDEKSMNTAHRCSKDMRGLGAGAPESTEFNKRTCHNVMFTGLTKKGKACEFS